MGEPAFSKSTLLAKNAKRNLFSNLSNKILPALLFRKQLLFLSAQQYQNGTQVNSQNFMNPNYMNSKLYLCGSYENTHISIILDIISKTNTSQKNTYTTKFMSIQPITSTLLKGLLIKYHRDNHDISKVRTYTNSRDELEPLLTRILNTKEKIKLHQRQRKKRSVYTIIMYYSTNTSSYCIFFIFLVFA